MTDSPMGPLTRLGKRLHKITGEAGLTLREFVVRPDLEDEGGPHHATAVFTLDEDFTPEPPKDDEWERFQQAQYEHEQAERERKAQEGLGDLLGDLSKKLDGGRDEGIL